MKSITDFILENNSSEIMNELIETIENGKCFRYIGDSKQLNNAAKKLGYTVSRINISNASPGDICDSLQHAAQKPNDKWLLCFYGVEDATQQGLNALITVFLEGHVYCDVSKTCEVLKNLVCCFILKDSKTVDKLPKPLRSCTGKTIEF